MMDRRSAPSLPPREPPAWAAESPSKLKYFHPHLVGMALVRETMLPFINQNGSFLVRISTSQEKTYTVSVVHNNGIKHFKILKKLNQYYLQDKLFPTIDSLVMYYGSHEVPNLEGITGVLLLFPILNDIGDRFTHRRDSEISVKSGRGSISSMGSSAEDDSELDYRSIFPRSSSMRQLPPPPGQGTPSSSGQRRRTESERTWKSSSMGRPGRSRSVRSDNMDERPPAPLPEEAETGQNGIYNGVYYSCVKSYGKNKLPELMNTLEKDHEVPDTFCECGLDLELSQLPQGWSVHVSREPDSGFGRPFFMSPDQVTSWDLPRDVYLELNKHQQKFIKFLCDNYREGKPPPDANTQIQWSSTSSSGSLKDAIANTASTMMEAAGSSKRDSGGSTTGAAGYRGSATGGFTSRGANSHSDSFASGPQSEHL